MVLTFLVFWYLNFLKISTPLFLGVVNLVVWLVFPKRLRFGSYKDSINGLELAIVFLFLEVSVFEGFHPPFLSLVIPNM